MLNIKHVAIEDSFDGVDRGGGVIAALYIEDGGCYSGLSGVEPWPISRDARFYAGPYPVVAHPPCQRWGRFWHGSPRKPHQFELGADGGCFWAAFGLLWMRFASGAVCWSILPTVWRGVTTG